MTRHYPDLGSASDWLKEIPSRFNQSMPTVATDGKDGNGLKLEKIGPLFSSFDAVFSKITKKNTMVSSPRQNSFNILIVVLQEHFWYE